MITHQIAKSIEDAKIESRVRCQSNLVNPTRMYVLNVTD